MSAECRRGTGFADRSPQRREHGVGLTRSGHHHRDDRRLEQRGDGQGEGVRRHVFDPLEAAVMNLLAAASLIQPDDLDQNRVEKVGDRRVVECQVTVLPDAGTDDVGGFGQQLCLIVQTGLERPCIASRPESTAAGWDRAPPGETCAPGGIVGNDAGCAAGNPRYSSM